MTPQEKEEYLAKWMPRIRATGKISRYEPSPSGMPLHTSRMPNAEKVKAEAASRSLVGKDLITARANLIYRAIQDGKKTRGEISDALCVSDHVTWTVLKIMLDAGIVTRDKVDLEVGGGWFYSYRLAK